MEAKTFDEHLIELVHKNSLLYDTKNSYHNNAFSREKAWEKISATLGKDVKLCKRRWVTLRERYVKQKRLYDQAEASGGSPPVAWHLYQYMTFLAPFTRQRNRNRYTSGNINFEELSKLRMIDSDEVSTFEQMAKSIANNGVVEVTMEDCMSQSGILERDFRLIELVKCHKILYETAKTPVKAELRILAWRQISKLMDMDWKQCRTRWITLRERFAKEYRRELESKTSSVLHKPWYLYEVLGFLKNHVKLKIDPSKRKVTATEENSSDNLKDSKTEDFDEFFNSNDGQNDELLDNDEIIEELDDPLMVGNVKTTKSKTSLNIAPAKRPSELFDTSTHDETNDTDDHMSMGQQERLAKGSLNTSLKPSEDDDDEIAGFLVIIGRKLKTLDLRHKNKAMEDLLQYCNAIQNFQMKYSKRLPAVVMSCTNCDMRHSSASLCDVNKNVESSVKRKRLS